MAEYLTENAEFICSAGGMIKCREAGNNKVRFSGSKLLTTSAILASCKGICAIKTAAAQGTPQTCQCMLTAWSGGFSPGKIATGVPLLTNTATNWCIGSRQKQPGSKRNMTRILPPCKSSMEKKLLS